MMTPDRTLAGQLAALRPRTRPDLERETDEAKVERMREESFERAAADRFDDLERQEREAIQAESEPDMLAAALEHARAGRAVFPVNPRTKAPMISKEEGGDGYHDATTEQAKVRELWTRSPKAAVGWALPRGVIAIDLDRYKPGCVADALEREHGPFPFTYTLTTPGGTGPRPREGLLPVPGRTLVYRVNGSPKLRTGESRLGKAVDVKGDGDGYIILSPSLHPSGGRYQLEDTGVSEYENAPDWVVEALLDKEVSGVSIRQRFTRRNPCPVCNGGNDDPHGRGVRCYGYLSSDGGYAHCTREEHAGRLTIDRNGTTFAHRLVRDCRCGDRHSRAEQNSPAAALPEAQEARPGSLPTDWLRPGDGLASRPVPMARVAINAVLPVLHSATRGGIPTGSVTCVLGGPDSGKTGTAMTIADAAERQRAVVIHLTNDNGREAAEIRWGQMMGFDRTKLEEGDPETLTAFRGAFANRNVYLPDPDACDETLNPINTLEGIIERAKKAFPAKRVVLLVDSVQVLVPDGQKYESPRLRVVAVMKLLRTAAAIPGWTSLATSQTNRESFKNRKESLNTDPITAGAESGSIEFGCDLMIYLTNKEDGIRAVVTKNKPGAGRKPTFGLTWDRERARVSEPDPAAFEAEALKIAEQAREEFWVLLEKIVRDGATENNGVGLSTNRIQQKAGRREADVTNALEAMAKASPARVSCRNKGIGRYWSPVGYSAPEIK